MMQAVAALIKSADIEWHILSGISFSPEFYWLNPIKCWAVVGTTPQSGKQTPHAMSDRLERHSSHILFIVMLLCNSGSSEHFNLGNCYDIKIKNLKTSVPHGTDQLFHIAFGYLASWQSPWHWKLICPSQSGFSNNSFESKTLSTLLSSLFLSHKRAVFFFPA